MIASTLKAMTYEELSSEAYIKASWFGKETTNIPYVYMHGIPSSHRQQHSMGHNPMCPPCRPSNISQMESAGTPLLSHQPCPVLAVAAEALHGQDLWLALATAARPSVAPVWGTDCSLEPSQLLHNAQKEGLLVDTPGAPPSGQEAS